MGWGCSRSCLVGYRASGIMHLERRLLGIFRFPWTPVVSAPSGPKLFCYDSQLQTPLFSLVRSLAPPLSSHSPEGRCVPGRVFYLGGESTRGAAPSSPLGEWLFSGFLFLALQDCALDVGLGTRAKYLFCGLRSRRLVCVGTPHLERGVMSGSSLFSGIFWYFLEYSMEYSGMFHYWNILEHTGTWWNPLACDRT